MVDNSLVIQILFEYLLAISLKGAQIHKGIKHAYDITAKMLQRSKDNNLKGGGWRGGNVFRLATISHLCRCLYDKCFLNHMAKSFFSNHTTM